MIKSKIEISRISKEGEEKKRGEIIHEEEAVVSFGKEIRKFYCIPTNLEEMIIGNLKSGGIDLPFSRIRKIGDNDFEVDISKQPVRNPQKCDSHKKLTSEEVFHLVKMLRENSFLHKETRGTHVVGVCGEKEIFVEDISRHCAIDKAIGVAVREAEAYGITLIGFASPQRFNIYSHGWRVEKGPKL